MRNILIPLLTGLLASFRSRAELQAETAALHHQLDVLHRRSAVRPRLQPADRIFWVWLSRLAALTKRRLTFREIFSSTIGLPAWRKVESVFARCTILVIVDDRRVQRAA